MADLNYKICYSCQMYLNKNIYGQKIFAVTCRPTEHGLLVSDNSNIFVASIHLVE